MGEKAMEPKARTLDGKPACIDCAGGEYYVLDGQGISVRRVERARQLLAFYRAAEILEES